LDAEPMATASELGSDVVLLDLEPLLIGGPAGREELLADRLTIDPGFIDAMSGDSQGSLDDRLLESELGADHKGRIGSVRGAEHDRGLEDLGERHRDPILVRDREAAALKRYRSD